jgi:hypothetical protein
MLVSVKIEGSDITVDRVIEVFVCVVFLRLRDVDLACTRSVLRK